MVANYSNLFTRNAEDVSNGVANWEAAVRLRLDDVLAPPKAHVSTLRSFKWEERFVLWAATTDLQIRGLPGFDVAIVYDEIFEMKGLAVPSRDDEKARMLDDFPAGSLLEPANKLRLKNPTRWGKRFAKKWEAIPCLADASSEFDVVAFYSEHAEVSRLETVPWTQPDVWILSPTELQARGHFPNIFAGLSAANDPRESSESSDSRAAEYLETLRILSALLTLDDQDARKRHLVRHHAAWDHASNGCCLGEVLRCNTSEIASELAPSELVDALRERARQDIKPDVRYDLDDLPDTADLVVLRSKRELDAAGRALDTCALSHADAVEKGDCVLLVLRSDKGAPFAIGDFRTKAGQWVSIREARGGTPNAETRAAFTGTTAKMRAWAEGAARKRKRREEYQAPTIYFRPRIR
ncbi:hypothetical protein M885DRAFT_74536 [Pelagophyceae sp. CCMP2097]|nr:hypothetical protein M885DRAFT_74536 [Pelagophyceae sp. CCMP2097]